MLESTPVPGSVRKDTSLPYGYFTLVCKCVRTQPIRLFIEVHGNKSNCGTRTDQVRCGQCAIRSCERAGDAMEKEGATYYLLRIQQHLARQAPMALASGVLCKVSVQVVVAVAKTVPGQITEAGKRSRIWPILRCSSFAFRPRLNPSGLVQLVARFPSISITPSSDSPCSWCAAAIIMWYCTGTKRTQNSAPKYCTSALYLGFISSFRTVYFKAVAPSFSACYVRLRAGSFANV
ncbi:hypothetical protein CMEL01_07275 [Colletotrichum melonis]|uniref:Uncharacterized protein n=1 Tax=Colletotrichum melonis TaxID=1209925 RepID=A0AAI9XH76_9PEZI|nr:hypothetical protein CMEL01_07275 [Colletotrichum melonis]